MYMVPGPFWGGVFFGSFGTPVLLTINHIHYILYKIFKTAL